jgi:hypothetical protein
VDEFGIVMLRFDEPEQARAGIETRDGRVAGDFLAACERGAGETAVAHAELADLRARLDRHAGGSRLRLVLFQRVAVRATGITVKQRECRAGCGGTLCDIGDRVRRERAFQCRRFELVVEEVRDRNRERAQQVDHPGAPELAILARESGEGEELAERIRVDARWRHAIDLAEKARERPHAA